MNIDNLHHSSMRLTLLPNDLKSPEAVETNRMKRVTGRSHEASPLKKLKSGKSTDKESQLQYDSCKVSVDGSSKDKKEHKNHSASILTVRSTSCSTSSEKITDNDKDLQDVSSTSSLSDAEGTDGSFSNAGQNFDAGLMTFPEKLFLLLEGGCVKDVMWWLPDGDAFCFIPHLFGMKVLDKHFQGTKFESFTRKLNRWGFKRVAGQKVPPNTVAYYHTHFHKDKPEQIKELSGGKSKESGFREKKPVSLAKQLRNKNSKSQSSSDDAKQQTDYVPREYPEKTVESATAKTPQTKMLTEREFLYQRTPTVEEDAQNIFLSKQFFGSQRTFQNFRDTPTKAQMQLKQLGENCNRQFLSSSRNIGPGLIFPNSMDVGGIGLPTNVPNGSPHFTNSFHANDPIVSHLMAQRMGKADRINNVNSPISFAARMLKEERNRGEAAALLNSTSNREQFLSDLSLIQRLTESEKRNNISSDVTSSFLAHQIAANSPRDVMNNSINPHRMLGTNFNFPGQMNEFNLAALLSSQQLHAQATSLQGKLNPRRDSISTPEVYGKPNINSSSIRLPSNSVSDSVRSISDDELIRMYKLEQQRLQEKIDMLSHGNKRLS